MKIMPISTHLIQFVAFLDLLAVGMVVPLIPNHVKQMGGNHIHIGLLGSIYAGFQLVSGPLIGSLSDLKGRKPILILTLLVCSLAYIFLGLTKSVLTILCIRSILGLFKQTQLFTKALVPDYEKDKKIQSHIYGKMAAIAGAGITIGPVIGGHVVEDFPSYGFNFIALLVGTCFVINAGFVFMLPKVKSVHNQVYSKKSSQNILVTIRDSTKQSFVQLSKLDWSKYGTIFLFKALNSFAMGVYYSNYSLFLKTQFNLSPKSIGYAISLQGVVGSISSFFMGYINSFYKDDEDYSVRNNHVFILLSFSLLGISFSYNILMYSLFIIPLAIGNAVGRLVTLEMMLKKSDGDHRGTLIGASNSVRSLTGVVAPMISGLVGEFFGIAYVLYVSLFSALIGLIMSYSYKSKRVKND